MKKLFLTLSLTASVFLSAAPIVRNGQKISFLGDSITGLGTHHETGFVNLVIDGMKNAGVKAVRMPAGKGGDKSPAMLARLQRDSLRYKPDFLILSCGVNDVWHSLRKQGVDLPDYKKSMRQIVTDAKKAGVKVLILTPTIIYEDLNNDLNKKLVPYNAFLKKLATEENCIFVDTNAAVQQELFRLKKAYPNIKGNLVTIDGVHMNPLGDAAMAKVILKGLGLSESEIGKAEAGWKNRFYYSGLVKIRMKDFEKILKTADKNGSTISEAFNTVLYNTFDKL